MVRKAMSTHLREASDEKLKTLFLIELLDIGYIASTIDACPGVNREKYYRWVKEDPEFADDVRQAQEAQLDKAETRRDTLIYDDYEDPATGLTDKRTHWPALKHYLNAKGKDRGYGTGTPVEGEQKHVHEVIHKLDPGQLKTLQQAASNIARAEIDRIHKEEHDEG